MLGGPLGALAGAAVGAAVQKVLIRVGDEFAQRQLGPREQTRAGAALYFALTDIEERLRPVSLCARTASSMKMTLPDVRAPTSCLRLRSPGHSTTTRNARSGT